MLVFPISIRFNHHFITDAKDLNSIGAWLNAHMTPASKCLNLYYPTQQVSKPNQFSMVDPLAPSPAMSFGARGEIYAAHTANLLAPWQSQHLNVYT